MTLEIITTEKVRVDTETANILRKLCDELHNITYNLIDEIDSVDNLIDAIDNFLNDKQIVIE